MLNENKFLLLKIKTVCLVFPLNLKWKKTHKSYIWELGPRIQRYRPSFSISLSTKNKIRVALSETPWWLNKL